MEQFKDYHLYIGQEALINGEKFKISGIPASPTKTKNIYDPLRNSRRKQREETNMKTLFTIILISIQSVCFSQSTIFTGNLKPQDNGHIYTYYHLYFSPTGKVDSSNWKIHFMKWFSAEEYSREWQRVAIKQSDSTLCHCKVIEVMIDVKGHKKAYTFYEIWMLVYKL